MRVPGLKSLTLSARWLRSRLIGGALILGYHRVAEPVEDPYSVCVTRQHFSEQLEVLRQYGRVISLQDLVSRLDEGRVPNRRVVLTFDDGYADVLYHARPLLERHQTPATVFVATGYLGSEFWWDKLERVCLSSTILPEAFPLETDDDSRAQMSGDPNSRSNPGPGRRLLPSLYRRLLFMEPAERDEVMAKLCAGIESEPGDRPYRRGLTADELIELAAGDLIDVGAHTVTHPMLASLSVPAQRSEIQKSKRRIEEILGAAVTCFSYPNGSSSQETRAIVRESGFRCGCASYSDVVWRGSDCLRLPRFWMPDWDGDEISCWLRRWLPG